jgi:hypothetical protein
MSEPTGDGKQNFDPDKDQVQDQDQNSGSDFGDPTAPVWVDPTAAVPAQPTPPGEAYPYGQQPAVAPQAVPQSPPPVNNPYAQQPYAQQPPVNNPYAQQPPAYGPQYYATGAPTVPSNTSAIILTILSVLSLCNVLAIGSLVLGIIALTKNAADPQGSRRMTRVGWIVFAAGWAIMILGFFALMAFGSYTWNETSNFGPGY